MKMWIWMPAEDVALNVERNETWLWTSNETKHGSEHRNEWYTVALNTESKVNNGSKRWTKQNMAPNVGMNDVMALNAEREYDSECQTEEW